jgi:cysteine desulfurase/selenocysteine lyase
MSGLDVERVRKDFPILARQVHGRPLAYLDSAASSQKPRQVIDALVRYYTLHHANIHRAVHQLGEEATAAYEDAREKLRRFLGAGDPAELVFVRSTTEAINLVAQAWGRAHLRPGDEVLISELEHHSNIVPWQLICEQTGARLLAAPIDDRGEIPLDAYRARLSPRTRMVALAHVSNALGTWNPVEEMIELAHRAGAVVLLDGAQAAPHLPVDVRALGCDFYALSGHKMYGPTGIGALWGRRELLEAMPPYQGGGSMIRTVTLERSSFAELPHRFEAGTPAIADAVGLGAAVDYLTELGMQRVAAHGAELLAYAVERLAAVPGLRLIGTPRRRASVVSFTFAGVHPHDVGTILDREGVAVRAGHHCAQPTMDHFGIPGTVRASFGIYNTTEEIDRLVSGLERVREIFIG